ncbi:hypothetical protein C8R47DRAFT_1140778 [Mycena vitilis]|nr:hypothetical protein C8R47DRAFT_1140778 [Mycena vitilis]
MATAPREVSSATELVSCTVVALPNAHSISDLQSHTFLKLIVPATALKTPATNGVSIELSSLLLSLLSRIEISHSTGEIPSLLVNMLTHITSTLRVSTTAVPIFDNRMQTPSYGYRILGFLSLHVPPSAVSTHILTINPAWNLPETQASVLNLEILGAQLDRHFIIIVSDDGPVSDPSIPPYLDAAPSYYPSSSVCQQAHDTSCGPCRSSCATNSVSASPFSPTMPSFSFDMNEPLFYFPNVPPMAFPSDDYPLSMTNPDTITNTVSSPASASSSPIIQQSALEIHIQCPRFVTGLGLDTVFDLVGFTSNEVQLAQKRPDSRPHPGLWDMVQNHRHAVQILHRLGLSDEREKSAVNFDAGLTLTTGGVVAHLGWKSRTFTRKSGIYRQARGLATHSWKGTPPPALADDAPDDPHAETRELYRSWQGIVALFGPGGFVDGAAPPRSDTLAPALDRLASQISQNSLERSVKQLESCLQSSN